MKDAYYFSHDSNARNDPKILAMRSVYGSEGYGWYWMIVEILREQDNFKLPLTKYTYDVLAMQTQCERSKIEQFMNDCFKEFIDENGGLFSTDGKMIWSNSLIRRMEALENRRAKAKLAAEKRWERKTKNANAMPMQCEPNAVNKEKKSKVKESKYINYYINNINPVASPIEIEKLCDWENDLPEDVICLAIEKAVEQNKRNLSYIDAILRNWLKENLVTVEAVRFKEKERKGGQNGRTSGNPQPNNREGRSELDGIDFRKFEYKG